MEHSVVIEKVNKGDLVQMRLTNGKRTAGVVRNINDRTLTLDKSRQYEANFEIIPLKLIEEIEERISNYEHSQPYRSHGKRS